MDLNNKRIVVIGANGMLGTMLMQHLPNTAIPVDQDIVDISDEESVANFFDEYEPEVVINAAAFTAVDDCEDKSDLANAVNGEGPTNLARSAKKNGATLVHYSTDYVFSGEKKEGYTETYSQIDPVNAYGVSKAQGEAGIQAEADDTWDSWYIVRTAWLYGSGGNNFVDTMLKLAQDRDSLKVVNDQFGSPTYTADLVEQTVELLTGEYEGGVYHATNSGSCTWFDFASEIFKQAGVTIDVQPCTSEEFPRPAKRPQYSILLNTKLPEVRSWQTGLAAYLEQL